MLIKLKKCIKKVMIWWDYEDLQELFKRDLIDFSTVEAIIDYRKNVKDAIYIGIPIAFFFGAIMAEAFSISS